MPQMLSSQLVQSIIQYINNQSLIVGARLPERALAEHLRVSRSPVRTALAKMAEKKLISRHPEGGYVVAEGVLSCSPFTEPVKSTADEIYFKIANDRLNGELPEKVTENEMMRRYGITRSLLSDILLRIHHEGWIERLPGHGWMFAESMSSGGAYNESYRFRKIIEPAGILEPTFKLDRVSILQCHEEQEWLCNGAIFTVTPAQIFDANTRLHEAIAACSGNMFILDSLRRLNRVRRLMEYTKAVDRDQALRRCKEHLVLIGLLLENDREAAYDYMRMHLSDASREKQAK
ncbi:GntR family transcriptional regulator [Pantoea vagans]|uniref:GntR family transcriptional regulator n=1 Tax=Pantoea vagans TaxID=470934 RepID=UPI00225759A9|nr:GntR family transcriptional regulator [Pantoea vagans]MCX3310991.1 GntR family transcriptional regulator [Pantoea vagans]